MSEIELYSFDDIINASFVELSNKLFIDIDNNDKLGFIWAKYGNNTKINAIIADGIIEFISEDRENINKIYGKNYNKNKKVFKAITTRL